MSNMDVLAVNGQSVYDIDLYESVLDSKECRRQLNYLSNSSVVLKFLDASAKIPNGMLSLNLADYGDYFECLNIDHTVGDMHIQGKYTFVNVPFEQKSTMTNIYMKSMFPNFAMSDVTSLLSDQLLTYFSNILDKVDKNSDMKEATANTGLSPGVKLGLCIPKVCTVKQIENFMNTPLVPLPKLTYSENYYRLPNDKPYTTADYIALGVFGTLFLLTLLSTCYDLFHVFIRKKKECTNRFLTSFSIYTNTRRFVNFQTQKDALECVDGIRALSMIWVLCGHNYIFSIFTNSHNAIDIIEWTTSFRGIWISSSPIVVDTFFTLSGIFCIYIIPDNITAKTFLKHIHIFYLYRILRVFPLLATIVLLQSSVLHWISDGPNWEKMAIATEVCRMRWWTTLLHIQNYYRPLALCVFQSWYIAVDTQLYFISPFIIVFLLKSSMVAWIVLGLVGSGSIITVAVYTFKFKYPSALLNAFYSESVITFFHDFYLNTLTRASPFIIGIIFGYVLKQNRGKKIEISKKYVILFWLMALGGMAYCIFAIYETLQIPYQFSVFDAILNGFMRGIWGASVCWMIMACAHGYGGPVNWFLSLPMWKLPARLSYAVYLVHLQIILVMKGSEVKTPYFSDLEMIYEIAGVTTLSLIIGFVMCVFIDAPASTLVKLIFMSKRSIQTQENGAVTGDSGDENKSR